MGSGTIANAMDFVGLLDQIRELVHAKGRVSYRLLKRQFDLDDEALEDLKYELTEVEGVARDQRGEMLVLAGEEPTSQTAAAAAAEPSSAAPAQTERATGERRQLTVMFCDLVGSTALSEELDPEELQQLVRAYQEVSAQAIERYEGYIAQYLGDGLLVYFGYPAAHEDDAARAIRAGLEIVGSLDEARSHFPRPVRVRIGIHTGPVVVGEMGGGNRHEQLASGEAPNVAARVQGVAEPGEVVVSSETQRLAAGLFETEDRGLHDLKGVSTPQRLYRIAEETPARGRFEVAVQRGLTPLVGREEEVQFLRQRWAQAQAGDGQTVLVSGEPGIGKSRLVRELHAETTQQGATQIEFRCSPYHQNSALHPIIGHLQRLLEFEPDDTPEGKLAKLRQEPGHHRFPEPETVGLLAALLVKSGICWFFGRGMPPVISLSAPGVDGIPRPVPARSLPVASLRRG